jgi:basic membrane lipoprotein Med (substrate-binding protein (PBP1-ABC) superfamily)
VGHFDDPIKSRQTAEALISSDYDILASGLNLGNYGLFEAAMDKPVYITTMYTDKSNIGPKNYLSSEIFDFTIPLGHILDRISEGQKGGYFHLDYGLAREGKPRYTQLPAFNVSDEINTAVSQTARDVQSGKIKVTKNLRTLPEE